MEIKDIKRIDQYLCGELSPSDATAFEIEMQTNASLRNEVEAHQELIEGIERATQRAIVSKARKRYHLNQLLKWGTISMSAFLLSAIVTYQFFGKNIETNSSKNNVLLAISDLSDVNNRRSIEEQNLMDGTHEKVAFPISFDSENSIDAAIPKGFIVPSKYYNINPNRDTLLRIGNQGTALKIMKHSFIKKDGTIVTSNVRLEFQEYRNSAEITFSGIPMIYKNGGEDKMFNSSGMFSLYGTSQGNAVEIAPDKPMKMDYRLVRKNPETNFYVLKEDSTNWEFVSEIKTLPAQETEEGLACVQPVDNTQNSRTNSLKELIADTIEGVPVWGAANPQDEEKVRKHRKIFERVNWGNNNGDLAWDMNVEGKWGADQAAVANGKAGTLLGGWPNADPGHSYPDIIRGLNIGRFGVYNCDQIYRLGNPTNILAKYTDENGSPIVDGKVLSMIDLNYTGAFSFDPKQFMCNPKSNNVLVLFTKKGEMYLLEKGEFAKTPIKNGSATFQMKNVTKSITSSKELDNYLGAK